MALLGGGTLARLLLGGARQLGKALGGHVEQGLIVVGRCHHESSERRAGQGPGHQQHKGASGAFIYKIAPPDLP